jgi:uncharacterized protein (DUF427 family)
MTAQPQTAGPGPGFAKKPEHTITLAHEGKRVSVVFNGETIAETRPTIRRCTTCRARTCAPTC